MLNVISVSELKPKIISSWQNKKTPLITGSRGIGKTTLIRNIIKESSFGIVEYNLRSELTSSYYEGIIRNIENSKNKAGVVIFFDNLDKVKNNSLDFLKIIINERKLGDYLLNDNDYIITTATAGIGFNEEDYDVNKNLNELSNFLTIFNIDGATLSENWLKWAKTQKLHPFVISFIEEHPLYLHYCFEDSWAVPASWETASTYIRYLQKNNTPIDFILDSVGYSQIGKKAYNLFKEYVLSKGK